ncbi:MAG: hypothetical protein ACK5LS_10885 [Propioniciclava sp.]
MSRGPRSDALIVVQVWLATRLSFAVLAVALAITGGQNLDAVVAQWDVAHYLAIATGGYTDPQQMAFFPGWPLILGAFDAVGLPPVLLGSVVALGCSLAAAFALQRLGGRWAAVAWLLAPTAIFTAVPYTEAAFCAAAFWSWERARKDRWGQAALLAALACTLRVSGLFLVGALVILAITQKRRRSDRLGTRLAWLILPAAVLVAYTAYLYGLTGSWTAWYSAQQAGWQREFHWPWEAVAQHWSQLWVPNADHPEWVWVFRAELVAWAVGILVAAIALIRKQIAEAAWVGVQVLAFSLSYWLMSVNRAVLLWFPLWEQIGSFVESRPASRGWIVLGWGAGLVAFALQMVWAWLYLTGRWAS